MQHVSYFPGHGLVAYAKDEQAEGTEREIACGIVINLIVMNAAVSFHDYAGRVAVEVRDEAVNELLAAEVQTAESIPAQARPEEHFLRSHLPAKFACAFNFGRFDLLACDEVRHGRLSGRTYPPGPPP